MTTPSPFPTHLQFTNSVSRELATADTPWAPCPLVYKDGNALDRVCVRNPPPGSTAEPCHRGGDSEWVEVGEELAQQVGRAVGAASWLRTYGAAQCPVWAAISCSATGVLA